MALLARAPQRGFSTEENCADSTRRESRYLLTFYIAHARAASAVRIAIQKSLQSQIVIEASAAAGALQQRKMYRMVRKYRWTVLSWIG